MIIKRKVITILVAVMMMATAMAVPSFAFASDDGVIDKTYSKSTEGLELGEVGDTVQGVETQIMSRVSLKVTWDRVAGADGYVVYAYNKNSKNFTKLKTVKSGKKTSYTAKKLTSNKKYYYAVASYDVNKKGKKVYSEKSKVVAGKTPKKLTPQTKGFSKTPAAVVRKVARSKKGCAYVHGTAGPRSFDCSGFVYWVMKHSGVAGVKMKRYTAQGIYNAYGRYRIGRSISKAQPGDIVLFGRHKSRHSIYHAAIYYGNGKVIHASTGWGGGKRVKITKADTRHIAVIIRLPGLR